MTLMMQNFETFEQLVFLLGHALKDSSKTKVLPFIFVFAVERCVGLL